MQHERLTRPVELCDQFVDVREAAEADMAAIQAIYAHHVYHGLASFEEVPPTLAEMFARRADVLKLGLPYLAAEVDGDIVGYCYAMAYRGRPAYRLTIEDSVYVAPANERRGVGRALLTALVQRCEIGPWRQMVAIIGNSSNFASIGLHQQLGFRIAGTLEAVGFKFGRWVDSVLMQRALGSGNSTLPDGAQQLSERGPDDGRG
jgi:phosphinothricin acetyltransferase